MTSTDIREVAVKALVAIATDNTQEAKTRLTAAQCLLDHARNTELMEASNINGFSRQQALVGTLRGPEA